jgi:hypothetical protein
MFENNLSWRYSSGTPDQGFAELWGAPIDDRNAATLLSSVRIPATLWKHTGLQPAQRWYYWARVSDTKGNESAFYPNDPAAGVACAPSSDPSALLTQLQGAVGLGQITAELANPITQISDAMVSAQSAAESALHLLLKADELKQRAQIEQWVTNATATIDPATGRVTLLATAQVSTDVEAALNAVRIELGAQEGTISSHTSELASHEGRIISSETEITQLQGQIAMAATQRYVDGHVAAATQGLDPQSLQANADLAAANILQTLLDADAGRRLAQGAIPRLAVAEMKLASQADQLSAEASARLQLAAQVDANAAAITVEQTARASNDSANAQSVATVAARLNAGGDVANALASVTQQASVTASLVTGLEAQYVLQVNAAGRVAGMLIASGMGGTSVVFLADKFLVALPAANDPNGTQPPIQAFVIGTLNGQTSVGIDGNVIIDGSIVARALAVTDLSAITASLGTVTAGVARNAANTNIINLDAVGSQSFLKVGNNIDIKADGSATFTDVVISRQMMVSNGTYTVGNVGMPYTEEYAELAHWDVDTSEPLSAWAGANATYIANGGVFGTVTTYTGAPPDVYWGVVCTVLPLTKWSGNQVIRLRLSLWGKHVLSVANFGINWKLYKVT